MMIKVMILDTDWVYLRRLAEGFKAQDDFRFEVYFFTDKEKALESLWEHRFDIFLAGPEFEIDPELLPERVAFAYLCDDLPAGTYNGYKVIGKSISLSWMKKELLNIYGEKESSRCASGPRQESGNDRFEKRYAPESKGVPSRSEPSFSRGKSKAAGNILARWFPRKDVFRKPSTGDLQTNMEDLRSGDWLADSRRSAEDLQRKMGSDISDVRFRCAAPMVIKPGRFFTARIILTREGDTERAKELAAEIGDKVRMASGNVLEAEKGQKFTLRLQSPDLPGLDELDQIRWNGKYAFTDFQILLPGDYDREQLRLLGRVYSEHVPLTDIKLILEVNCPQPQEVACETLRLRTAFISYSSKDRAEVVKRLQMFGMLRPDMNVFMDRLSLRRGEEYEPRLYREIQDRDLFYLFWSRNAAGSEWVKKELDYALAHKPLTHIEPIWLEKIEDCPPPEALQHLHFWDWTQNYL